MFIIVQSLCDRDAERVYSVYIRSCKVVEKETGRVVMDNLHYLDAYNLKRRLNDPSANEKEIVENFKPYGGGHASVAELEAIAGPIRLPGRCQFCNR